jgi:hypothetical protein
MSKYYNKNKNLVENLINCFKTNKIFYTIFFGAAAYISLLTDDLKRGLFTITFMVIFSYLSHMVGHKLYPINIFHKVHHNDDINHTFFGRTLEWIVNFLQIGGLLLIPLNRLLENKTGVKLFNEYIIVFYSLVYTTHHMINYHVLEVDTHIRHHKNVNTNYGPDYMDVLLGTKQHNSTFEDMRESILNTLLSAMVVIILFSKKILH